MKPETPTLDKMLANQPESQAIGNFLEWLTEKGMFVAHDVEVENRRDKVTQPVYQTTEQLLARYFDVDLAEAEREKQKILESLQ